jgi:8-oxo-dGTP pyrophosphatase MutT (NUDIX family)
MVVFGESVCQALIREFQEEIGGTPSDLHLVGVYSTNNVVIDMTTARRCSVILAFHCGRLEGVPTTSDEVVEVRYYAVDELPEAIILSHRERIYHGLHPELWPILD